MKTILIFCLALVTLSTTAQTIYTVTKTTDPDPFVYLYDYEDSLCDPEMYGTLQWAIRKANDTPDSVRIEFNIPGSGPDTIYINYELPVLYNQIAIDGTTQQGYETNNPAIIINGGYFIVNSSYCSIKGLYIQGNSRYGIMCYKANYITIEENVINQIDHLLTILWQNEGAISLNGSSNCIIRNNIIGTDKDNNPCSFPEMNESCVNAINMLYIPASGRPAIPYYSNYNTIENNTIANSGKGIYIQQHCVSNKLSQNKITLCYNAITLLSGANADKYAPEIDTCQNEKLVGISDPFDIIEVFGSTGDQQANAYLGSATADENGNWQLPLQTFYNYAVATATDENGNTSALSERDSLTLKGYISQLSPDGLFDTILDRFGNQYTLDEIRFENPQTRSLTSMVCGGFEVFFENNCGLDGSSNDETARKNILCQVLNDLSDFLNISSNTNKVNLLFKNFSNIPNVLNNVNALGSAFYSVPSGLSSYGGIVDNQVWKTIISDVDAYTNVVSPLTYTSGSGFYHAFLSADFNNYSWNTDLSNTTCTGLIDLYTILLHELVHDLGFNSLINQYGDSKLGADKNYKSRYDLFLQACNSSALLVTSPTPASPMYNYNFNSALNNTYLLGLQNCDNNNICNSSVKYISNNVNQFVYTPISFNDGSSLSHFEDLCFSPYNDDYYFVMSNSTGTANVKRYLKPEEKNVLCNLGYNLSSTYGSVANNTWHDYSNSCSSGMVVGINDGIDASGNYLYIFNSSSTPLTFNPLNNDIYPSGNNIEIRGFEHILGTGTAENFTTNTVTIKPNTAGLNIYRYVPYNTTTQVSGNITYIFAFYQQNCTPNACNLVSNGDFEALTNCGEVDNPNASVGCWYGLWNTADYFKRGCTHPNYTNSDTYNGFPNNCYLGMGSYTAYSPELMQTTLSSPLIPSENYILSFYAKSNNLDGWSQNYVRIYFASSPTTLAPPPLGFFINPTLNQIVSYSETVVNTSEGWKFICIPFTFNGSEIHNNLVVGNNTVNSDGFTSYLLMDDISIKPVSQDITLTLPASMCYNDALDLSAYATPTGGTFTGNGVSGNILHPTHLGENTVLYSVMIDDCPQVNMATINVLPSPSVSVTSASSVCGQDCDGSVDITVSNGTSPFTYNWSNSATTQDISSLCAGNYTVTVTDANGCSGTQTATINSMPVPTFVNGHSNTNQICSGEYVIIGWDAFAQGQTFSWAVNYPGNITGGQTSGTGPVYQQLYLTGTTPQVVTFVVTTTLGNCTAQQSYNVTVYPNPDNLTSTVVQPACGCDGSITINDAASGYTFNWSHNTSLNSNVATGLCIGNYSVTITDANGCSAIQQFTLTPSSSITYINNPGTPITFSGIGNVYTTSGNVWGDIIIQNGAVVTFDHCTLKFQPGAKIILGDKSKIYMYSAYFTNISECNQMWNGMEGTPCNITMSSSTIENAMRGINIANDNHPDFISNIINSTFLNNYMDIYVYNSNCTKFYISGSTFKTDIPVLLSSNLYPYAHIYLYKNNDGFKVVNSLFTNTTTYNSSLNINKRGYGIYTNKTQISVNGNTTADNFKNLFYGIFSHSVAEVKNCVFRDNFRGILAESAFSYPKIQNNKFYVGTIGNGNTSATTPCGLFINNSNTYTVTENSFSAAINTDNCVGLIMNQNPVSGRKIYHNWFTKIKYAFIANTNNGVKLNCNDFGRDQSLSYSYNGKDIGIFGTNAKIYYIQDHIGLSGYPTFTPNQNTHNRFFNPSITYTKKFYTENASQNYFYYYGDNTDQTKIQPIDPANNNIVSPQPTNVLWNSNNCPSEYTYHPTIIIQAEISKMEANKDTLLAKQNEYTALVDSGQTGLFLQQVNSMQPDTLLQLVNRLMALSPYISDTILIRCMIHPINDTVHKMNLVLANSPLPFKVRPYIDQMAISDDSKKVLWAYQQGAPNGRVALENEIASRDFGIKYQFGELLTDVLHDTIPERTDSVLAYVLGYGNTDERIMASPVFIQNGTYTNAQSNLDDLELMSDQSLEISTAQVDDYIQLQSLELQLAQTADSLQTALVLQNQSWLLTIASDSLHFGQSNAMALLEQYTDTVFPRCIWTEGPEMRRQNIPVVPEKHNECVLAVWPNPASSVVNIDLPAAYVNPESTISLYDNTGKKLNEFNVASVNGHIALNIFYYVKGNYYIALRNGKEIICTRILIVK